MVSITMHGLYVENRTLNNKALSWNLAHDIHTREAQGKVAVVTDNPIGLLASTRRQWLKLIRQLQRKRSATLGASRIEELIAQIVWMQNLTFTSKLPDDLLSANVTFATADDFVRLAPVCRTMYVTYHFEREKLHMLTAWMPINAVVVVYGQG
jgi:hypothetical protein